MSSRFRRPLFVVAGNLAITLVLLAVTELVCRQGEQMKIDSKLPEQLRKLPAKDPSELRVFTFGGSTVYGVPVPEVGFVAQMQYWLQRLYPERHIRVYNYGWWGKDTAYVLRQVTRRLDDQPDLVIVITGHNEFFGSPPGGRIDRLQEKLAAHFATVRLLHELTGVIKKRGRSFVMPCQVTPWDHRAAYFDRKMGAFAETLHRIVRRVTEHGVPLIVGTLPSNLSDWPPVHNRLAGRDAGYAEVVSRIQQLLRDGKVRAASDALGAVWSSYPDDAMLYFLRGKMQSATGAYGEARESFIKARDLDPVPYRATSQINAIVRRVASGIPGVLLLDLERAYQERATNGLVGFDLIGDNVHGTPLGESITAQTIMHAMSDIGFLPAGGEEADACCPLDRFLADVGYLEPASPLRLRAALDTATYVMKTPWLNLDAARMYLLEALKMQDASWKIWANLATVSYLTGDNAAGAEELRRATALHPEPFDLDDRGNIPYLKEALDVAAGHAGCGTP